ncbi:MAG TPA: hypothetical protein VMG81_00965 [Thermoplasmata archaeon]|nr:hypothetical protein [Thermoplasmata archaeon]
MAIAPPGPGPYALSLATPGFYVLVATLAIFLGLLFVLWRSHPNRKRGLEGYLDAAGVSLAFLVLSTALVIALATRFPLANRTSYALFEVVLTGYWLGFAIPVVTVGSSVEARSRRAIRWFVPSVLVAVSMFFGVFGYYYLATP